MGLKRIRQTSIKLKDKGPGYDTYVCLHPYGYKDTRKSVSNIAYQDLVSCKRYKWCNRWFLPENYYHEDHAEWWLSLHPNARKFDNRMKTYYGLISLVINFRNGKVFDDVCCIGE